MKLLYWLTGGRPMRYSEDFFFDCWHWNPVDLYEDKFGRRWLARSSWDIFRKPLRTGESK